MSSIYKLSIAGVRSFDPRRTETIEFGRPLTLIVGQNGVGKTTIIECLKYATTGRLPPNSMGGAFIHDPNMVSDKQVTAEVKLAFTNINGQSMITSRTAQLIRGAKPTFKTLEGKLMLMNRGERSTVSTKCAELEYQVPRFLGVPDAILDYVIFCHQEEGLWPLSEPSVLKKKFDEIFQALKFTKAVETLKSIRKDLSVEVKLLEQSVKHMKSDKERADRTLERLETSKKVLENYNRESEELEARLLIVTEESDTLFKSNQEFQQVLSSLESLNHSKNSLNDQISRLQEYTKQLPDSNEELQYKIANFQEVVDQATENVNSIKTTIIERQDTMKGLREQLNSLNKKEGQLRAQENEFNKNVISRRELAVEIAKQLAIDFKTDDYDEFEAILHSQLQATEELFQKIEEDIAANEGAANQKIKIVTDSILKERQHAEYAEKDIKSLEAEVHRLQGQINDLCTNEGNLEYEKSVLDDLEEKLKLFKANSHLDSITKQIDTKNGEIATIETEIEAINRDISQIHKQADVHAKVSLLRDELKFKEKALSKLVDSSKSSFEAAGLDMKRLSDALREQVNGIKEQTDEISETVASKKSRVQELQSTIRYKTSTLTQLESEIAQSQKKFDEELEDESVSEYPEILAGAEDDYKTALENMKMSSTTLQFNKKALEIAETNDCCYLCSRKFDDTSILANFIKELKLKTNGSVEKQLEKQVEEAKEYLSVVRSLAHEVEIITGTRPKVDLLNTELSSIKAELAETETSLNEDTASYEKLKTKLNSLENLKQPVSEVERTRSEVNNAKNQVETKENELSDYGFGSQTLEELQETLSSKNILLKETRKLISSLQNGREDKQRQFNLLEGGIKDKRLTISNMEISLMAKESLSRSITENSSKIKILRETVARSEEIISANQLELDDWNKKLAKIKKQNQDKLNEHRNKLNSIRNAFDDIKSYNDSVKEFLNNGYHKLKEVLNDIESTVSSIENSEEEVKQLSEVVSAEEKKLANNTEEHRNLKNNLDIRRLHGQLLDIERQIENIDVSNAEAARERYQEESARLRDQYSTLNAELAGKKGEAKQILDQIKETQRELNTEFKDVHKQYREELARFRFKSVALDDALTYSTAIDTAIMNYHTIKMTETNKIIEDLWKSTYSGTDVDTIRIKSEPGKSTKTMRQFNYRVVMVKNDVELDMRGRCSAGQKVLASIIIRLALAECFGTNCGVIALDEPTTNLDQDNIESLARSLSNIIDVRQSQKNFQLIVITHDEKFLNAMNASKHTDHFYRIKRNASQKSEIEWVGITKVSE